MGIALRSLIETVAILKIVEKRQLLPPEKLNEMYRDSQTLAKKLYALRAYLDTTDDTFREPGVVYKSKGSTDWNSELE